MSEVGLFGTEEAPRPVSVEVAGELSCEVIAAEPAWTDCELEATAADDVPEATSQGFGRAIDDIVCVVDEIQASSSPLAVDGDENTWVRVVTSDRPMNR